MFYDRLLEHYEKELGAIYLMARGRQDLLEKIGFDSLLAFTGFLRQAVVFKFERDHVQYFYNRGWLGKGFAYEETFRLPYPKTFFDFDGVVEVDLSGSGIPDYIPQDPRELYESMHRDRLRGVLLVEGKQILPPEVGNVLVYTIWDDMNLSLFYVHEQDLKFITYPQLNNCAHLCSLPQNTGETLFDHPICRSETGDKLPHKTCTHAKAMNRILSMIANCMQFIHAVNVETVYHPGRPAKYGKKNKKLKHRPLSPYYTLRLRADRYAPSGEASGGERKTHRRVSHPYTVRGHFRRLQSGKVVWVRPHVRGLRALERRGIPQKRYLVTTRIDR